MLVLIRKPRFQGSIKKLTDGQIGLAKRKDSIKMKKSEKNRKTVIQNQIKLYKLLYLTRKIF